MNAEELLAALNKGLRYPSDMGLIEDAARLVALPILEKDHELRFRIHCVLGNWFGGEYPSGLIDEILAALIPTEEEPPPAPDQPSDPYLWESGT